VLEHERAVDAQDRDGRMSRRLHDATVAR
jgi:hypothetical protein